MADNTRHKFTGQQRDAETELDYFLARYYAAAHGRFTSPDAVSGNPLNPQTLNLYAYVQNNPLKFIDPTGHLAQDPNSQSSEYCWGCPGAVITAAVDVQISFDDIVPLEATNVTIGETIALRTTEVLSDTGIGFGKEAYNTAVGFPNTANAVTNLVISPFTDYRFGYFETYAASTSGEQSAMYATMAVGAVVGGVSKAASTATAVEAGEAGRYADLARRSVVGDGLTPHHMPQAALNFTSRADGGALVITHAEHVLTRTYGRAGAITAEAERGLSFRTVLARDIRDIRSISGSKYNQGLLDLTNYYRTNFPNLMTK